MPGYTKLFQSILHSTIWTEDNETRIVWITMLAMADKDGSVQASVPGLARMAGVTVQATEAALEKFQSPDQYSRTPENEGRRIKAVPGGWTLLNHGKYRRLMSSEERREYNRQKQADYRKKKAEGESEPKSPDADMSLTVNHREQCQHSTDAEADTKAKEEKEGASVSAADVFSTAWNELPSVFPKIRSMSQGRTVALRARLKDDFWRDNWREALRKLSVSTFCRGVNDRGWVADVDFFLRPDTVSKIMEGKYDEKRSMPAAKDDPEWMKEWLPWLREKSTGPNGQVYRDAMTQEYKYVAAFLKDDFHKERKAKTTQTPP